MLPVILSALRVSPLLPIILPHLPLRAGSASSSRAAAAAAPRLRLGLSFFGTGKSVDEAMAWQALSLCFPVQMHTGTADTLRAWYHPFRAATALISCVCKVRHRGGSYGSIGSKRGSNKRCSNEHLAVGNIEHASPYHDHRSATRSHQLPTIPFEASSHESVPAVA